MVSLWLPFAILEDWTMRVKLRRTISWWICLQASLASPLLAATPEVTAPHAMVVASSGAGAADAGLELLKRGGTAMDAAMAVAVAQPCHAMGSFVSYAGILTLVYFDAASGKVYSLDGGFNTVRGEKNPLTIPGPAGDLVASSGGGPAYAPSGRTALAPGFFAGVEAAHKRFGKRPFAEIVEPAIRCAEQGFALTKYDYDLIQARHEVLERLPETKAVFAKPDGSGYHVGEIFKQPALARTLHAVARQGALRYLYKGAWGKKLVAAVRREGGFMTLEDLDAYAPTWSDAVHGTFNGYEIYSLGPPMVSGLAMIQSLQLTEKAGLVQMPLYSREPSALFKLLQISKVGTMLANPDGSADLAQRLHLDLSAPSRLQPGTTDALWSALQGGKVPMVKAIAATEHTASVVAVDAKGNVAAVVHSINTVNWGSTGLFVEGISIPDSASFQQRVIASLPPGARLPETTHPGVVLQDGQVVLGFGASGIGSMTRAIAVLLNVLGHGMTPQEAIDEPSLGGFEARRGPPPEVVATVGQGEFDDAYLKALSELGQSTKASNSARGYWLGIGIDPKTGTRHAGIVREFPQLAGGAVGY
jgi:gamma-glutamyltranspeptidase / glutathione hydrolase